MSGPPWTAGKNGRIDRLGEFFLAKHDAAARAAQTLVRRRGDEVRMRHRARMFAGRDESGDVRHVDEEERVDRIGDLPKARKIEKARISRSARGDHRRAHLFGLFGERVVVDLLGLFAHAVVRHLVKFAGEICRMAVGQMTAVGEIHRQDAVARFDGGEIDRHVRLRAAVRLHVDVLRAEDFLGAIDRQLLDDVDVLATAVPTFPRITFGVLVRQAGTLRLHHRAAREIFRGDQLDVFALASFLRGDRVENFGVDLAQTRCLTMAGGGRRRLRIQE